MRPIAGWIGSDGEDGGRKGAWDSKGFQMTAETQHCYSSSCVSMVSMERFQLEEVKARTSTIYSFRNRNIRFSTVEPISPT